MGTVSEREIRGRGLGVRHGLQAFREDLIPGVMQFPRPGTTEFAHIPIDHHVFGAVDTVWVGHERGSTIVAFFRPVNDARPVALLQVGNADVTEDTCALRTVLAPVADRLIEQAQTGRLPNPTIGAVVSNPDVVHNVFAMYSRALAEEIKRRAANPPK